MNSACLMSAPLAKLASIRSLVPIPKLKASLGCLKNLQAKLLHLIDAETAPGRGEKAKN